MKEILQEWEIDGIHDQKISTFVTDNGYNMVKALKIYIFLERRILTTTMKVIAIVRKSVTMHSALSLSQESDALIKQYSTISRME